MEKRTANIMGHEVKLTIHRIEGEVSEVYAYHVGTEIAMTYTLEDMESELSNYFAAWI